MLLTGKFQKKIKVISESTAGKSAYVILLFIFLFSSLLMAFLIGFGLPELDSFHCYWEYLEGLNGL